MLQTLERQINLGDKKLSVEYTQKFVMKYLFKFVNFETNHIFQTKPFFLHDQQFKTKI